jgi:hypothetical protein
MNYNCSTFNPDNYILYTIRCINTLSIYCPVNVKQDPSNFFFSFYNCLWCREGIFSVCLASNFNFEFYPRTGRKRIRNKWVRISINSSMQGGGAQKLGQETPLEWWLSFPCSSCLAAQTAHQFMLPSCKSCSIALALQLKQTSYSSCAAWPT